MRKATKEETVKAAEAEEEEFTLEENGIVTDVLILWEKCKVSSMQ